MSKNHIMSTLHHQLVSDLLAKYGVHSMFNVLCSLLRVQSSYLHALDLLHKLYLGLLEHLMEWIKGLLKRYKCQDHFDKAWKSVPSYHKLTKPNKPYRQVS